MGGSHGRSREVKRGEVALELRPVDAGDWSLVRKLFGERGACGGCWCMWWRLPRGGKLWEESKGTRNRRALNRLLRSGKLNAILALAEGEPVGWCSFGPRADFPRLERVRALQRRWGEATWSVVCFYLDSRWRGRGIASRLLEAATARALELGATEVEGYPVIWRKNERAPAAFAYTGLPPMYRRLGYRRQPGKTASLALYVRR